MKYAHLHGHSEYSLSDGCMTVGEYVNRLDELGIETAALTDTHNLFGAFKFHQKAFARGIKPIIGVDLRVGSPPTEGWETSGDSGRVRVLVADRKGYRRLSRLISASYRNRRQRGLMVPWEELAEDPSHLWILGPASPGPEEPAPERSVDSLREQIEAERDRFGERYYVEVPLYGPMKEDDRARVEAANQASVQPLITHPTYFGKPDEFARLRLRTAVQSNTSLEEMPPLPEHRQRQHLVAPETLREWTQGQTDLLEATAELARRCTFEFDTSRTRMPPYPDANGDSDGELRRRTREGLKSTSVDATDEDVRERLDRECSVIAQMGFSDYFLIVADIVNWAREQGIRVGPGRGSAAGSLVAYLLGITRVDPFAYDLIFERFLNPQRREMPDIDVDFADHRRGEVIEYVRRRFGAESVAHIITFGQMKARNALRDVGRIRGEPSEKIDEIAELIPSAPQDQPLSYWKQRVDELSRRIGNEPDLEEWFQQAQMLEGLVRNPSVHAAGILITPGPMEEEIPLYVPDESDPVPASQFDMYDVQSLGYLKLDLLGLSTLTVIEKTLGHIPEDRRPDLDDLPAEDERTAHMIAHGSLEGVFQFESSGSRRLAREMRPTGRRDLIDCIALYRPGPLEMREPYLKRRRGEEPVEYPHEDLKPILEDTYGLIIYQEQVMAIARRVAGFSWAEADRLRKAMGKKRADIMETMKEQFLEGAEDHGYDPDWAEELFETLAGFAEYGFNRSHSAAYGEITYQTAYLKAHYPVEFYAAFLSVKRDDRDRIGRIARGMRTDGVALLPPDINRSGADFSVESEGVRYGLSAIKHVGESLARVIEQERRDGPYEDVMDFVSRVPPRTLRVPMFQSLAAAGCFDSMNVDRGALIERAEEWVESGARLYREQESGQGSMFGERTPVPESPADDATPSWEDDRLRRARREVLGYLPEEGDEEYSLETLALWTYPGRVGQLRRSPSHTTNWLGPPQVVARVQVEDGEREAPRIRLQGVDEDVSLPSRDGVHAQLDSPGPYLVELEPGSESWSVVSLVPIPDDPGKIGIEIHLTDQQALDQLRSLKQFLDDHPGPNPVRLRVHGGGEPSILSLKQGISLDIDLGQRLRDLLSPSRLRLFPPPDSS